MQSTEVRQKFLDFFASKGHKIVPSAPIVQKNDPTLMFTNAGMNQFKDIFLGNRETNETRVADTQKCLRVSGKHNDLEEVGFDTYHHTMFEMLGNWSFGDYFKAEAIAWAWELLTEVYGLPKDRLYATIFEGDKAEGLAQDEEARKEWLKVLPGERILPGNKKDNFWEMGDVGPCGPSSEIHIDMRPEAERQQQPGAELVNQDHPQVIEIWNLVFIQYNRMVSGNLKLLPQQHVDTGMGFERLLMVLQGKTSSYDTDLFQPIIRHLEERFGKQYGQDEMISVAMRVAADHCRAITFTIADGQMPSNTGAGYVIRRILRRAVRYGYRYLGANEPFLHELVPLLTKKYSDIFPELKEQQEYLQKLVREEENAFLKTLATGTKLFEKKVQELEGKTLEGRFVFELYDTFGFPVDLTRIMATEEGLAIDEEGFQKYLNEQKTRSKKAAAKEEGEWQVVREGQESSFIGYDSVAATVQILRWRKLKEKKKEFYQLVFNQTPFYPEGGGQVGDTGVLEPVDNGQAPIEIRDTKRENELIIHIADELPADPLQPFQAKVDAQKRQETQNNHSATHLLHQALRTVLGEHVQQRGSLVNDRYLRFDFSHYQKVTDEEVRQIEEFVNARIRENVTLQEDRQVPIEEARSRGAMALFGEKYGENVRVITFGSSVELCGGTHTQATGRIGLFRIRSEGAVAAGVRRIEAVTGAEALAMVNAREDELSQVRELLKNPQNLPQAVQQLQEENKQLQAELEKVQQEQVKGLRDELAQKAEPLQGDVKLIAQVVELPDANAGKDLVFALKNQMKGTIILLGAGFGDKANLWLAIPEELAKGGLNAGSIIREAAKEIQGGGGGQPFFASAGGKNPQGLEKAIERGKELVQKAAGEVAK